MRVVCDLNVVVSGLIQPQGPSGRILHMVRERRIALVCCPRWLAELEAVLARPKFRRHWSAGEAGEVVLALAAGADLRPDPSEVAPVTADPDDDYLVALALDAGCQALVSGDRHLLAYGGPPPVRTPREVTRALEEEQPPPG